MGNMMGFSLNLGNGIKIVFHFSPNGKIVQIFGGSIEQNNEAVSVLKWYAKKYNCTEYEFLKAQIN